MDSVIAGKYTQHSVIDYKAFGAFLNAFEQEYRDAFGNLGTIEIITGAMKSVSEDQKKNKTTIESRVAGSFNRESFTQAVFDISEEIRVIVYPSVKDIKSCFFEFSFFDEPSQISFFIMPDSEKGQRMKRNLERLNLS